MGQAAMSSIYRLTGFTTPFDKWYGFQSGSNYYPAYFALVNGNFEMQFGSPAAIGSEVMSTSFGFRPNGSMYIFGSDFINSSHKLVAGVACPSGSPGAGTSCFGDGSWKTSVVTATPTVGQAACIYAAGPPVQIGKCTSAVGAGGACTCAP
jgi:hypothetical protein